MYSILSLAVTLLQLIAAAVVIAANRLDLISSFIIYGSPIHLVTHIYEVNPFLAGKQLLYFLVFSFHSFKYFFLARAFFAEEENMARRAALVMEIMYLFMCGYYIHP